jgi:hypothetical protein
MAWADDEIRLKRLHDKAKLILDHILFNGRLERKDLPGIAGTDERQARRIAQPLVEIGLIRSVSTRAPYHLAFPAEPAPRLMPMGAKIRILITPVSPPGRPLFRGEASARR